MSNLCHVAFATGGQEYTYLCMYLVPQPNTDVVVKTNDGKLKIVRCVRVSDGDIKPSYKELYATLFTQTDAANTEPL